MRPHYLILLALLLGCRATPDWPAAEPLSLPDDWQTEGPWDFEQAVAQLPLGAWSAIDRQELALELSLPDSRSIRAAVLLAHGDLPSAELLLGRLEARQEEPKREGDAAEIVAAAALGQWGGEAIRRRLTTLATGPNSHPDLEVRVECACVALDLGQRGVIPFLLRVLHALTPAEREDPIDWTPTEKLAWAKGRAAAALSRAAGRPNRFRADGSWQGQIMESEALATALGIRP